LMQLSRGRTGENYSSRGDQYHASKLRIHKVCPRNGVP